MPGEIFFTDLRTKLGHNLLDKITSLMEALEPAKRIRKRGLTAIKIHFGERGNTSFIRPLLVRPVVDVVVKAGGKPFLTDANTLYVGSRGNAVDHLNTALLNGFSPSVVGAPLIIADGIDGTDETAVRVDLKHFDQVYIGTAVTQAPNLISLAHFKLHEMSGFGGAIKNVGMGAASRRGKMAQHCEVAPMVSAKLCVGCGTCLEACAHGAIELIDREVKPGGTAKPGKKPLSRKLARTSRERCVGCGACIHTCPTGAMQIDWGKDLPPFMERMVEYTVGTLKGKENHSLFLNFLMQITPACDCYPNSDAPIAPDIGILAGTDPVAIDQASVDLLNAQAGLPSSCLKPEACGSGSDKVRAVYPHIQWEHQMEYAEKVGLGGRSYNLVRVK